jgi:hypothetical protein
VVVRPISVGIFFALGLTAAIVGCSSTSGTPTAPIPGGAATATPTLSPSPSPTPTPKPIGTGSLGSADACALLEFGSGTPPPAVTIPGTYSLFVTEGEVTGSTYAQTLGEWAAFSVSGAPVATPTPSATPVATATPAGSATPTPTAYDVFTGTYSIPAFSVTPTSSPGASPAPTPIAVSPTVGCAVFIVTADGSPIGGEATASPINSESIGIPNYGEGADTLEPDGVTQTELAQGYLTSFDLTNLTAAGGSATYVLDAGVTGNVTYGPAQIFTDAKVRALKARMRSLRGAMFAPRR